MELNTIEKSSGALISARTNDSALEEIAFATGETVLGTAQAGSRCLFQLRPSLPGIPALLKLRLRLF